MSEFNTLGFEAFPKIARLNREIVITEKIDGTNGQLYFPEDGSPMLVGSRSRWITPGKQTDNHGFARWAYEHREELQDTLGYGRHYGEWWGSGIQRGYGLEKGEKRFSLFNVHRWGDLDSKLVDVVPMLYTGGFSQLRIEEVMEELRTFGSRAVLSFMKPEGIVIYHTAARTLFKITLEKDEAPKSRIRSER